jgi:hypothetical protein
MSHKAVRGFAAAWAAPSMEFSMAQPARWDFTACGFSSGAKPLPIGLQHLGPNFSEQKLLRIARMYESATDWHARHPIV